MFTDRLKEIMEKYQLDPKVSEMLKRLGPPFPAPGPHYSYADLVEHMRHSLYIAGRCEIRDMITYHIPEILKRRKEVVDSLVEASPRHTGRLREEEYWHAMEHISRISSDWEKELTQSLSECMCKKP